MDYSTHNSSIWQHLTTKYQTLTGYLILIVDAAAYVVKTHMTKHITQSICPVTVALYTGLFGS
jgi:hypothetical protein